MADMLVKLYGNPKLPAYEEFPEHAEIQIKRALTLDRQIILDFVSVNFPAASPGWTSECEASLQRLPTACFVAEHDRKVVGFACYDATAKGFFGPIGVTEDFRGRGIARALMAEVFRAMAYEGYGYAVISWVNATGYYRDAVGAIEIPDSEPGIYVRKIGK